MKFRKKPVVIEAIQFDATSGNRVEISKFVTQRELRFNPAKDQCIIEPREGNHIASKGDWIIRGVEGEFYPVKNDIFLETYEKVD